MSCKYLSKITNIKQVKCFKEFALLHSKYFTAGRKECSYILQAQKLKREKDITFSKLSNYQQGYSISFKGICLSGTFSNYYNFLEPL